MGLTSEELAKRDDIDARQARMRRSIAVLEKRHKR